MKKNTVVIMPRTVQRLGLWAIAVIGALMIPFVTRAPWTASDFVFAGIVLFGSATVYEFITRNMSDKIHRLVVGIAILTVVMLIWAWAVAGP